MFILALYPILELISLISLAQRVGFGSMILYVVMSFFVGLNLIRSAGMGSFPLNRSHPRAVTELPFRVIAGVLILLPGLVSDILALLILIPFVRRLFGILILGRLFKGRMDQRVWRSSQGPSHPFENSSGDDIIFEVKGERVERVERDVTPSESVKSLHSSDQARFPRD